MPDARRAVHILQARDFPGAALYGSHVHLFSKVPETDAFRVGKVLTEAGLEFRGAQQRPVTMEDVFVSRVMALELAEERPQPRMAAAGTSGVRP